MILSKTYRWWMVLVIPVLVLIQMYAIGQVPLGGCDGCLGVFDLIVMIFHGAVLWIIALISYAMLPAGVLPKPVRWRISFGLWLLFFVAAAWMELSNRHDEFVSVLNYSWPVFIYAILLLLGLWRRRNLGSEDENISSD